MATNLHELTRDELVERYTPRVVAQIARYIAKNPAHRTHEDDMTGECLLKLVEVVDLFLDKKIDNFEGYLHQSIRRAIAYALRSASLIITRSKNHPVIVFGGVGKITARPIPDMTYEEAFYELFHTIKDDRDARIFQLRWNGIGVEEVAARLGISRQTVVRRLKRMQSRYDRTAKDKLRVD